MAQSEQLLFEYKKKYLMVSCKDKLECSFDQWYNKFRKQTIKSRIIPLNDTFIEYLKKDGLKLPPQIQSEMDNYYELDSDNDEYYKNDDYFNDDNKSNGDESDDKKDDDAINYAVLDDLFDKIRAKIKVLKGEVIPKLNWSSPKDAKWINNETLKCDDITSILLLLKSSQFVQSDLFNPFYGCFDYESNTNLIINYKLILRKYCNLYPNREFRCFIFNHEIIAITQRNDDDVFKELQNEIKRNKIRESIETFFKIYIENEFGLDKFVMDIYIDKAFKVYIIDFNPFYVYTDTGSVLSWIDICQLIQERERNNGKEQRVVFGYIHQNETAKIKFNSNTQYRYPIDAVDLSNQKQINAFVESCKNK